MYRAFNLDIGDGDTSWLDEYLSYGKQIHESNKKTIESRLDLFKDLDGSLLASKIIEGWFPPIEADVFLSHSHKDANLVIALSGWLKRNFGLRTFIDSCVWGYSDKLLKQIDNAYCYDTSEKIYSYDKRNRSTSHVHMMLSTSLAKMINACECIIFVSTPSSISPKSYVTAEGVTESPWIYSEIALTNLIQRRSPSEHRKETRVFAKASLESIDEALTIKYDLDSMHLTPLTKNDLLDWRKTNTSAGTFSLDTLYRNKQMVQDPEVEKIMFFKD